MQPQSALAVFVGVGLLLCYLTFPIHKRFARNQTLRWVDAVLALGSAVCCLYVIVQTEPVFESLWANGQSLGNRAGGETTADFWIGLIGVLLVLEATRRSIGMIVPLLAISFVAHSYYCYGSYRFDWAAMPDWMLPHAGQSVKDIVSTTFLQSLGVFGPAASVMFKYVFLFVVFGSFLEMSGATQFIIDFATKTFGRIRGGPAMVSVMASGLMGSLSGSAVANAVTTGTFTIPMMRSARFPNHIAGGITAAAASGGALVPPVMGAGAYMMLELVQPQVKFVTIMKAAVLPAILYYLSILAVVFLYSRRLGAEGLDTQEVTQKKLAGFDAIVFCGALGTLIALLVFGFFAVPKCDGGTCGHLGLCDASKGLEHFADRAMDGVCEFLYRSDRPPIHGPVCGNRARFVEAVRGRFLGGSTDRGGGAAVGRCLDPGFGDRRHVRVVDFRFVSSCVASGNGFVSDEIGEERDRTRRRPAPVSGSSSGSCSKPASRPTSARRSRVSLKRICFWPFWASWSAL